MELSYLKVGETHVVFRSHTVFFRLVLAYACVFKVLNARQIWILSRCHGI